MILIYSALKNPATIAGGPEYGEVGQSSALEVFFVVLIKQYHLFMK